MTTTSKKRVEFETYRPIEKWEQQRMTETVPSVFNDTVHVRRYRITCELIEDPDEVIIERLQNLYWASDNFHDTGPLQAEADKLGVRLTGWGKNRKR